MIAILASRWDTTAQDIASAWSGETVSLMTARDLSRRGWRQSLGVPDTVTESACAMIEGQPVADADIQGVLTRLPWVTEAELPEIVATDRAYVAAEMSAFLLYWLSRLRCPVLNLPTPTCLSGPGWRAEHWASAAAATGMAVRSVRRNTRTKAAPLDLTVSTQVTVVGSQVVGEVASELKRRARHLAQLAGVDLLTLRFGGSERDAEFLAADVFPSLDDESVRYAVLDHFAGYRLSRPVSVRTVLLWGTDGDAPLTQVRTALETHDCRVVFLDQGRDAEIDVSLSVAATPEGTLSCGEARLDLAEVSALYLRPADPRELTSCAGSDDGFAHALTVHDLLLSWADLTPALVLNRPNDMAANNSKPYQAQWIESLGFRIPATLLTTDPAAARAFLHRHDRVIYKSISGVRSIVSRVTDRHLDRFEDIGSCPTQFQEYIAGREFRVHVVRDAVIATEILSTADDYRYADDVQMRAVTLPEPVASRCQRVACTMRLPLAGLDLRLSATGEWYCLEVNPSPGFTFFEQHTGQPIAQHVARLLALAE